MAVKPYLSPIYFSAEIPFFRRRRRRRRWGLQNHAHHFPPAADHLAEELEFEFEFGTSTVSPAAAGRRSRSGRGRRRRKRTAWGSESQY